MAELDQIIDLNTHPVADPGFTALCRDKLAADGVLTLPDFLRPAALTELVAEAEDHKDKAYYTRSSHNVYLTDPRPDLGPAHVFMRFVQG